MKWLFPLIATGLASVSLLTTIRAPDWMWAWKLTILVDEYGHWLAILALGLAGLGWMYADGAGRIATLLLCTMAAIGFLRPARSAWRHAPQLPASARRIRRRSINPAGFSA